MVENQKLSETRPIIAIQVYSVHQQIESNFSGAIRHLADIGFENVELYWHEGQPDAAATERILKQAAVRVVSLHVNLAMLRSGLGEVIRFCSILNIKNVILPWIAPSERATIADWQRLAAECNEIGRKLKAAEIRFGYHSHDFEFLAVESQMPMKIMLDATNPEWVSWQPDTFWIKFAGQDVLKWLAQYGGRIGSVHLKDFKSRRMVEVGTGEMPWPAIFAALSRTPAQFWILEQEEFLHPEPWDELSGGLAFIKSAITRTGSHELT